MKHNKVCFIECKSLTGKLSEIQKYRMDELQKKGFKCYVSYGNNVFLYDDKDFPHQLKEDEFWNV